MMIRIAAHLAIVVAAVRPVALVAQGTATTGDARPLSLADAVRESARSSLEVTLAGVDVRQAAAREREARIDDEDAVLALERGHVLPDLAETAEREDAARGAVHGIGV